MYDNVVMTSVVLYELSVGLPMSEWAELWAELRTGEGVGVYERIRDIIY